MKKLLPLIAIVFISMIANAQNLQITTPASANYTYTGPETSIAHVDIHVKNVGNSTENVYVLRKKINVAAGHLSYFCFGVTCYPPNVNKSPDVISLNSGASDNSIITYLDPLGTMGTSIVEYCVKNVSETDSACVIITYALGTTGIINNSHLSFVKVFPNPADNDLSLAFNANQSFNNAEIQLFDFTGKLVYSEKVNTTDGLIKLNVSEFTSGLYLCQLNADGTLIASDKVIIK